MSFNKKLLVTEIKGSLSELSNYVDCLTKGLCRLLIELVFVDLVIRDSKVVGEASPPFSMQIFGDLTSKNLFWVVYNYDDFKL